MQCIQVVRPKVKTTWTHLVEIAPARERDSDGPAAGVQDEPDAVAAAA